MKIFRKLLTALFCMLSCWSLNAQQTLVPSSTPSAVPRLVNYSGILKDSTGKGVTRLTGVTFLLYRDETGGSPLWLETQSIRPDATGQYTAQLGSASVHGLPAEMFTGGEGRWLGVQVGSEAEQPRVLLVAVPYAMKAADAETIGGLPPSAFALAAPAAGSVSAAGGPATSSNVLPSAALTGTGTTNYVPLWTSSSAMGNSAMFQTGTGGSARIGINQTVPTATLDVGGGATIRGLLNLPNAATATSAAGANSRPFGLVASTYNSSTNAASNQVFHWQAEPAGNNTASPSATLNLLYATAPAAAAETGLKINSKGQITFAAGQTFPGSGTGSVSSVGLSAPSSDFTVSGSPVTGSGTLALNWTTPPTSDNVFSSIVKRDNFGEFTVSGIVTTNLNAIAIGVNEIVAFGDGHGYGVFAESSSSGGPGEVARSNATGPSKAGYGPDGIDGITSANAGDGVGGYANSAGDGIFGYSASGFGGFFVGDVDVDGTLSKAAGSFKIDHPLDPANKYLFHSFVESPDMKNIYDGVATLNTSGEAVVEMPEWFDALNRDFRYQLTCIGGFAPVYIADEVSHNRFKIAGGKAGMKVSWQVTGTRQDAWANAHRIPVEQMKAAEDRGLYLHPELFGAPEETSIAASHHSGLKKFIRENKARQAAASGK